jgi:DNA-binding HxlR family transcriptional regulator
VQKSEGETAEHISRIIKLFEGKWKIHILWAMRTQPVRLSTLRRLYPTASKKALRAGLRDLEEAQIVVRHDLTDVLLHVEYQMVDEMRGATCDLLNGLAAFGQTMETKEMKKVSQQVESPTRRSSPESGQI